MNKLLSSALCAGIFSLGLMTSPPAEAGFYTVDFWFNSQAQNQQDIIINGAPLLNVGILSQAPTMSATMEINDSVDGTPNGFIPLRSGNVTLSSVSIGGASYELPGDVTRDQFTNVTDPNEWLGVRLDSTGRALRFDIPIFSVSNSGSIFDDESSNSIPPQLVLWDEDPDGSEDYIYKLPDGTFALLTADKAESAGLVQQQFNGLTQITALGQQGGIGQIGDWNAPASTGGLFQGFLRISRASATLPPNGVSEPGSFALFGLGLAALGFLSRRKIM